MSSYTPKVISTIIDFFKSNSSRNKVTRDKLMDLIHHQCEELDHIRKIFTSIEPRNMDTFETMYVKIPFDTKHPEDVSFIIPYLKKKYSTKVQSYEKKHIFYAQVKICEILLHLHRDTLKNFKVIMEEDELILNDAKVSFTIFLGLLREIDLFIKFTYYLYSHFAKSITRLQLYPIRYQAKYLTENVDAYLSFVNNVAFKENVSFISQIQNLKKKQKDYFLQRGQSLFTTYMKDGDLSLDEKDHLINGIAGFNIIGRMLESWDEYQHTKYLERKATKEWMENQQSLLMMQLQGIDPDDPEYLRLQKIIQSYEDKIAAYERKLREYEEE